MPDYLAAADVEAHDLQGYGIGTASLESMAAGVPVVAAVRPDNFPGIDLIGQRARPRAGPRGRPAALGRASLDLLGCPDLRARVGAAGQQLVREHFAMAEVLRQHLEVLDRMAGRVSRAMAPTSDGRTPGGGPDRLDHPVGWAGCRPAPPRRRPRR